MLHRIAHKHASLGVTPEQYDLVHEHLFAAIAEVLGDAVTPEVAAAWDEVYWLMANALIAVEKRLREESGGPGWRTWEVVERVTETADVVTFRLRPADGSPVRDFLAGQYVSVRAALPDGARQIRQYSLSGAAGPLRQISVKRVQGDGAPDGEVSNHLHARVREGDVLELSEPYGDLVLDAGPHTPLLLASAGIGVTPMTAMLAHLAYSGHRAPVTVVHGDRSPMRPRPAHRPRGLRGQAAGLGRPPLVRAGRPGGHPLRAGRPRRLSRSRRARARTCAGRCRSCGRYAPS